MSEDALLSEAARRFLAQAKPDNAPPPTEESIAALRADTRAAFGPRAERALERHGLAIDTTGIAGVPCLTVAPPDALADRTVLYFFGGGYITGSAFEDLIVAAPLAAMTQARFILPEYSLAPEHPFPKAVDEGLAVYRALSTGPFAIAGESAGGNLALAVMQRARREGLPMPGAAALLSPWCDLTHGGDSLTANDGRDPTLTLVYVEGAARLYAGATPRNNAAVSPILGALDGLPPTLVTSGTRDLLMSQSVELTARLRTAGVETDLRVWDGLWHVFEFYDELPEAAQSLREIAKFLSARFP